MIDKNSNNNIENSNDLNLVREIDFSEQVNEKQKFAPKIICGVLLLCLCGVSIPAIAKFNNDLNTSTYKSVVVHEAVDMFQNPNSTQKIIENANSQAKDTLELLKSFTLQSKKDNVFRTFYKNSLYYLDVLYSKINKEKDLNGVTFDKEYNLINPKTSLFITYYNTNWNGISVVLNTKYFVETYSKYLGDAWKKYITYRAQESDFLSAGSSLDLGECFEWIKKWDAFKKEYPQFSENDEINVVGNYISYIFIITNGGTISKDKLKAYYVEYLNSADKATESYRLIEGAYKILEKTNYKKDNQEFINYASDNEIWGSGN